MEINILYYKKEEYEEIKKLYKDENTFGGQYDASRDSKEKLNTLIDMKIWSILVAKIENKIVGTVTLFEDSRAAWLYRFAVQKELEFEISEKIYIEAKKILKKQGHSQVLVYAPVDNSKFKERYKKLGLSKGGDFTCFWENI